MLSAMSHLLFHAHSTVSQLLYSCTKHKSPLVQALKLQRQTTIRQHNHATKEDVHLLTAPCWQLPPAHHNTFSAAQSTFIGQLLHTPAANGKLDCMAHAQHITTQTNLLIYVVEGSITNSTQPDTTPANQTGFNTCRGDITNTDCGGRL